jgi:hypothetical protein
MLSAEIERPPVHVVKTTPAIFENVWQKRKCSELRFNDRDYGLGHILVQREYIPEEDHFTNRFVSGVISDFTVVRDLINHESCDDWVILHLDPDSMKTHFGVPAT